jgi:uncharacterized Zn finger protein
METLNTILSQLTYDDLDRWAGAKIRTRGKSYIKRVDGLHHTPEGQLVAWVAGTEEYATLVRPNEEGGHAWFCTCSYADGPCKHAVAVLLAAAERVRQKRDIPLLSIDDELHLILFDDRDDITQWHDEEGHEGTGAEAAAKGKPKLHKLLDGKSREELLELLVSLANDYPQVARVLVETEQLRRGQIDLLVRSLRREIQKLTRDPAWSNHWNGERSAPDYTHVCHQFKTLLAAGHADALLALGDELWQQGIEQVEQANDEGEIGSAIAECLDIVVQALPQSSMPASAQLLWVIDHLLEDEFGLLHSGEKALENPVYTREDWREVAAVLEKRMGEKSTSRSGSSGTFGRTDLLNFLILAYRQSGWHEKIVPLMEQEVDRLGNYGQLVDVLLAAGDPAQARRWCIHGFGRTIKVAPGTAERLQERLRQIAEAEQRHDLSAAHRAQEFFRRPLLEKYKDLRKAAEKVDCWPVVRAGALGFLETGRRPDLRGKDGAAETWPLPEPEVRFPAERQRSGLRDSFPDRKTLIDIAIFEKRFDDVVALYQAARKGQQCGETDRIVAKAVAKTHPDVALGIWRDMVDRLIAEVKPRAYIEAGGFLRLMHKVYEANHRLADWHELLAELRQNHKAKRRLLEVLDSLSGAGRKIIG